jgi:truncated hemoglobin YjbI
MPWSLNDAERHTHEATTRELRELWARVANETLERTGDEARAIREANAVIARQADAGD